MKKTEILYWWFFEIYRKKLYLLYREYKIKTLIKDFFRRQKYSLKIWLKFKINSLKSKLFFNFIVNRFEKKIFKHREKKKMLRCLRRCNCGEILIKNNSHYNCKNCGYTTKIKNKISIKNKIIDIRNIISKYKFLLKLNIRNIKKNMRMSYLFWGLR